MTHLLPDITLSFPHKGNQRYSLPELLNKDSRHEDEWIEHIRGILKWWFRSNEPLRMTTSGTTGNPALLEFERHKVEAAARSSMSRLGPPDRGTSLLAIHPGYAGGRMLMIRALMACNDLICIPPMANPLSILSEETIDYASLVPYQIDAILKDQGTALKLTKLKTVLIGGAAVSDHLWDSLCKMPNKIYSTYGMTETLSHVALKPAIANQHWYLPVPGISLSVDSRGCLVIESEWLGRVVTNDLAELQTGSNDQQKFLWKGRADMVINSGGILVHPEQIEKKLSVFFANLKEVTGFFITQEPDDRLGERVVLYIECELCNGKPEIPEKVDDFCRTTLRKEELPRRIIVCRQFSRTASGKLDRKATATINHNRPDQ